MMIMILTMIMKMNISSLMIRIVTVYILIKMLIMNIISTASGAVVVGGVRDIYTIHPSGDSFECSME